MYNEIASENKMVTLIIEGRVSFRSRMLIIKLIQIILNFAIV